MYAETPVLQLPGAPFGSPPELWRICQSRAEAVRKIEDYRGNLRFRLASCESELCGFDFIQRVQIDRLRLPLDLTGYRQGQERRQRENA